MKNLITSGLILSSLTLSSAAYAQTIRVTNGNDSGAGSFRSALAQNPRIINIDSSVTTIKVTEPLMYNGSSFLGIFGFGVRQTIDGSALSADEDLFTISQGASFRIRNLDFIGSLDEVNDNPNNPSLGTAIFVDIPSSRTGSVNVFLENMTVSRIGGHGVHISDCTVREECGEGQGSPASILVDIDNFTANRVGLGRQDGDGIRVDERANGNITFRSENSTFINVGADGVELDEADSGNIIVTVDSTLFDSNGEYCNLVSDIGGTPCDNDGDPDLDDGFDIDEAGDGSILVSITDSQFTNNFDEGLDFDEEGDGDIEMTVADSFASNNEDQGIRASEEDGGDVNVLLTNVTFADNNQEDEGIRIEEDNGGDLTVEVVNSNVINSHDEGIRIEESNSGNGTLEIRNSNFTEFDLDNVDQI